MLGFQKLASSSIRPWTYQSPQPVRARLIYLQTTTSCRCCHRTRNPGLWVVGQPTYVQWTLGTVSRRNRIMESKFPLSPWGLTPETSSYKGGILPEPSTQKRTPPPNDLQPLTFLCGLQKSGSHITLHKISILPLEPQPSGSSQTKSGQYYNVLTMRVFFLLVRPKTNH